MQSQVIPIPAPGAGIGFVKILGCVFTFVIVIISGNDDDGINFPLIDRMGNRSQGYLETTRLVLSQGGSEIRRYDYTFDADGYPTRIVCTVETKYDPSGPMQDETETITYTITYDN